MTRRLVVWTATVVVVASAVIGAGVSATAVVAPDVQVTTVWQLVNRHCEPGEVEAGRACFEPAGHVADYQFVAEDEAVSNTPGETQDYQYKLPSTIASDDANRVHLHAQISQVTDGAAHARFCEFGDFGHTGTAEPCATTAEVANGETAVAAKDVRLIPYDAAAGTVVTVSVGFEEPGGSVHFNYRATKHTTTIHYRYNSKTENPSHGAVREIDIADQGTFDVIGPLRDDMPSSHEDGTAKVKITKNSGATHSAHLELGHATYSDPKKVILRYVVTNSNLRCLPTGHHVKLEAHKGGWVKFDFCGLSPNSDDVVTVHLHAD